MDRLRLQYSLVALSGLALVMAASGCRDRNLHVPPPAHYSDGGAAMPQGESYPSYAAPPSVDPTAINAYPGASYGAAPNQYDPAATPTAGTYDPSYGASVDSTGGLGHADPSASAPSAGYDPAVSPGVYASPSSHVGSNPSGMIGTDPSDLSGPYGTQPGPMPVSDFGNSPAPAALPGIDGGIEPPPIPDDLPMMP